MSDISSSGSEKPPLKTSKSSSTLEEKKSRESLGQKRSHHKSSRDSKSDLGNHAKNKKNETNSTSASPRDDVSLEKKIHNSHKSSSSSSPSSSSPSSPSSTPSSPTSSNRKTLSTSNSDRSKNLHKSSSSRPHNSKTSSSSPNSPNSSPRVNNILSTSSSSSSPGLLTSSSSTRSRSRSRTTSTTSAPKFPTLSTIPSEEKSLSNSSPSSPHTPKSSSTKASSQVLYTTQNSSQTQNLSSKSTPVVLQENHNSENSEQGSPQVKAYFTLNLSPRKQTPPQTNLSQQSPSGSKTERRFQSSTSAHSGGYSFMFRSQRANSPQPPNTVSPQLSSHSQTSSTSSNDLGSPSPKKIPDFHRIFFNSSTGSSSFSSSPTNSPSFSPPTSPSGSSTERKHKKILRAASLRHRRSGNQAPTNPYHPHHSSSPSYARTSLTSYLSSPSPAPQPIIPISSPTSPTTSTVSSPRKVPIVNVGQLRILTSTPNTQNIDNIHHHSEYNMSQSGSQSARLASPRRNGDNYITRITTRDSQREEDILREEKEEKEKRIRLGRIPLSPEKEESWNDWFSSEGIRQKDLIVCQSCVRKYLAKKILKKRIKMNEKRSKVASELLFTERIYVSNLKLLLNHFLIPLMKNADNVLSSEEHKKNFDTLKTDITVLINYNGFILNDLEKRLQDWSLTQKIADLFLKIHQFLKSYTAYIQHYQKALVILGTYANHPKMSSLLSDMQYCKETNNKGIRDFLIMPVQRIPRYILLLRDLLSNTWETHIDYPDLKNAYEKICQVAEFVEEAQENVRTINNVISFQTSLTGKKAKGINIVAPHRKLIRQSQVFVVFKKEQNDLNTSSSPYTENSDSSQTSFSSSSSSSSSNDKEGNARSSQINNLMNSLLHKKKQLIIVLFNDLLLFTKQKKEQFELTRIEQLSSFLQIQEQFLDNQNGLILSSKEENITITFPSLNDASQWSRDLSYYITDAIERAQALTDDQILPTTNVIPIPPPSPRSNSINNKEA